MVAALVIPGVASRLIIECVHVARQMTPARLKLRHLRAVIRVTTVKTRGRTAMSNDERLRREFYVNPASYCRVMSVVSAVTFGLYRVEGGGTVGIVSVLW